ncbi:hypothetical protein MH215_24035 [Paenibacillus sp. ACRSA]|uniref:hypothetical protein n=1 Tax=Paenibacillus sp. ACRSA TaxID=2918211 RepID=UPI001EF62658|nr:hypothetical protein [Paenibacillus sp. ACRSA]MCG7380069.1 hypothetical protein [Paenibacillus sp. ACRSA]
MKKQWTLEQIKVFIIRIIESGNYITIQRSDRTASPTLTMNLQVERCVPIHNGVQFHVNGGYINMEFNDYLDEENLRYRTYEFQFEYDDERKGSYRVHFYEFSLLIPDAGFMEILENLDKEVANQRQHDEKRRIIRESANRFIDSKTWGSIDNMLEK